MKIAFIGNYRDCSGYSYAARRILLSLDAAGINVAARHLQMAAPSNDEMDDIIVKMEDRSLTNVDATIIHSLPEQLNETKSPLISMFYWETNHFRGSMWDGYLNNHVDAIIASSKDDALAIKESHVDKPTYVLPVPCDINFYVNNRQVMDNDDIRNFRKKFYTIAEISPRKGLADTILAYFTTFQDMSDVLLFLHITGKNERVTRRAVIDLINKMKETLRFKNYPALMINPSSVNEEEIAAMHNTFDTYVCSSRGESWNLPVFDAMAFGNVIISPNFGGMSEYLSPETALIVKSRKHPVIGMHECAPEHLYRGDQLWNQIDIMSLRECMLRAYNMDSTETERMSIKCRENSYKYAYDVVGEKYLKTIEEILSKQ